MKMDETMAQYYVLVAFITVTKGFICNIKYIIECNESNYYHNLVTSL